MVLDVVDGYGWLWVVADSWGYLWVVVSNCEWFWVVFAGCGWLWVVVGGCIPSYNPILDNALAEEMYFLDKNNPSVNFTVLV